jgi:hypothetical protein
MDDTSSTLSSFVEGGFPIYDPIHGWDSRDVELLFELRVLIDVYLSHIHDG